MSFPFVKKGGGEIGESLCLDEELDVVADFLLQANKTNTNIILPVDCVITNSIKNRSNISISQIDRIPKNYMGVDIGPKTIQLFEKHILDSKLIMWNGPMGIAETEEFAHGTKKIANLIVSATRLGAYSLIGGGDTVSDVARFGLKQQFSYVSTGGGAMLEFFKNNYLEPTKDLLKINNKDC
jgi:phosphoglycerate kinase